MTQMLAAAVPNHLVHLAPNDLVIVVFYFALVLSIDWYLKGRANTGEDFFMPGREMTAWVTGLSFLSANLGALELMGWAGSAYQYGILATHWYWIGAIPAMLFSEAKYSSTELNFGRLLERGWAHCFAIPAIHDF